MAHMIKNLKTVQRDVQLQQYTCMVSVVMNLVQVGVLNDTCDQEYGNCTEGCKTSIVHGQRCHEHAHCPKGCNNGLCDHESGNCTDGCTTTEVYGSRCNISCNESCEGGTCNRDTGYCDKGCKLGTYGDKCDILCSNSCMGGACGSENGFCTFDCVLGRYGDRCDLKYNDRCLNLKCERIGGNCTFGCILNYLGSACNITATRTEATKGDNKESETVVETMLWLTICGWTVFLILIVSVAVVILRRLKKHKVHIRAQNITCSKFCIQGAHNQTETCNNTSGECFHGCKEGSVGPNCSILCPENCLSDDKGLDICNATNEECLFGCKDGFYGSNCTERCSDIDTFCERCTAKYDNRIECKKCRKGSYLSGERCLSCNYYCLVQPGSVPSCRQEDGYCNHGCKPGRFGLQCGKRCSATCQDECNRETGKCSKCSYPSYCGSTCEIPCQDGCFLQRCKQSCQCEKGCHVTHWGGTCKSLCSINCIKPSDYKLHVCNETDGTCLYGCNGNKYWGNQCTKPCSDGCINGTCDQESGICTGGCKTTTVLGQHCDEPCPSGCANGTCDNDSGNCTEGCRNATVYGSRCNNLCNEGCEGGTCNRDTGYCNKRCKIGMYGNKCDIQCSESCKGGACGRENGFCFFGCVLGRYGDQCELICNDKCLNLKCERIDGNCTYGCILNYLGSDCNITATRTEATKDMKDDNKESETVVETILWVTVCGWTVFLILMVSVAVVILRRLKKHKGHGKKTEATIDDQSLITFQQEYTTLQHEQGDVKNYEELKI